MLVNLLPVICLGFQPAGQKAKCTSILNISKSEANINNSTTSLLNGLHIKFSRTLWSCDRHYGHFEVGRGFTLRMYYIVLSIQSCEMPLCIAVTQHKSEIFELIAKRMDSTERQYYVAVSILFEVFPQHEYQSYLCLHLIYAYILFHAFILFHAYILFLSKEQEMR